MEERIEDYFKRQLSDPEKAQFEKDLKTDPELAESVAFYLLVKKSARQEIRDQRLAERHAAWQQLPTSQPKLISRQLFYYAAAAVLFLAMGLGWYFLNIGTQNQQALAGQYVSEHFSTLNVHMDGNADSLQQAIDQYNKGNYKEAGVRVDAVLRNDPQNAEAQKIAGIVSLQEGDYDKAINHFQQLGNQKQLFSNPGRFYEAIARLQRGSPLDKKLADSLLREVIDGNLEGKKEAVKWVK
jgi:tetratricopeptide (TPR) repeat protein